MLPIPEVQCQPGYSDEQSGTEASCRTSAAVRYLIIYGRGHCHNDLGGSNFKKQKGILWLIIEKGWSECGYLNECHQSPPYCEKIRHHVEK